MGRGGGGFEGGGMSRHWYSRVTVIYTSIQCFVASNPLSDSHGPFILDGVIAGYTNDVDSSVAIVPVKGEAGCLLSNFGVCRFETVHLDRGSDGNVALICRLDEGRHAVRCAGLTDGIETAGSGDQGSKRHSNGSRRVSWGLRG